MGIFSGGFSRGLLEGVATGANRTITVALDKRQEEMSAARKYMQQRRIQQSEKYAEEGKEMEGLMKGFSELTNGNLDKAAQLIKGAGNIEQANARLALYNEEKLKNENFDINAAFNFAESKVGEGDPYVIGDYVESLISRPSAIDSPIKRKKFGLGLANKILGEDDSSEITMPEAFGRTIDIGTAQAVAGATSVATEFERQQEAGDLQLKQARANLKKTLREAGEVGAVPVTQVRQSFASMVAGGIKKSGMAATVDLSGNVIFDLKDSTENFSAIRDSYATGLKSVTEDAISTNALNTKGMIPMLKTSAIQTLDYVTPTSPTSQDQMVIGELYNTKNGIILYTGSLEEEDLIIVKSAE
jgi:soluble cytochrome b562